ncbi:Bug family tripartite tricarboxylate transporter substrate binding protein [Pollutimonas harenae]|uniref:Tripartite tricarboxylate transporter substrate binding protein n=1 Tax=Pollutimonas harenae TaxID=657015 RepID=A0A853GYI4_9BURK|nr:tripartite tricarboxylate transporter substrate binding protein [Pollutimonas harenae]NYT85172.1 tripartite tricarboxylate transporter substrate binding protein [Pollutimonas harenae]TEA72450.1 tripartite tricarboxylate transporter substrate binding protein [Pollutimonas harenae]
MKASGLKLLAAGLTMLASSTAWAQYPERPITMIVPFPPGGVTDTVARPIADALGKELGQSVVVENKAGAGGAIGTGAAAHAKPDGYTIMLMLSSISILPEADKILGRKAAYETTDFKPIARITADPTVLVVPAKSPWKTIDEFVEAAREAPGKLNYGSSGIYGSMHVPMAMLEKKADIRMTHVPYTGAGPAVAALLSGQVDAISTGPSSILQHIKAGTVRPLAHWGDKPLNTLPEVPSLSEAGYDVKFVQWSGIFVPKDVPAEVIQRLREAAKKVANDPDIQKKILAAGSPIDYMDADEFQTYWDADDAVLRQAVQDIGKLE